MTVSPDGTLIDIPARGWRRIGVMVATVVVAAVVFLALAVQGPGSPLDAVVMGLCFLTGAALIPAIIALIHVDLCHDTIRRMGDRLELTSRRGRETRTSTLEMADIVAVAHATDWGGGNKGKLPNRYTTIQRIEGKLIPPAVIVLTGSGSFDVGRTLSKPERDELCDRLVDLIVSTDRDNRLAATGAGPTAAGQVETARGEPQHPTLRKIVFLAMVALGALAYEVVLDGSWRNLPDLPSRVAKLLR